MTTKQYLQISLSKFELSEEEIDLIIVENGLDPDSEVQVKRAKEAIHASMSVWLPIYSNVTEGGVSKGWNIEALKLYYAALSRELGKGDVDISGTAPSVRDRSNLW